MSFTPGPWHLEGCEEGGVSITDGKRLEPIAVFSGADRIGNATLAAAAPELLALVHLLVDPVEAAAFGPSLNELQYKARAIIAKVEGES